MVAKSKPMPMPDKQEQILAAAVAIIGNRGFYGFSIRQVAQACDLTVQGVLHYFPSKVALLNAAIESRELSDFEAVWRDSGIVDATVAGTISIARFRELLHAAVVRNSQQPEYIRLFSMLRIEALYADHPAHAFCQMRSRTAQEAVLRILEGKVADPVSTARQVIATIMGLEELWLESQCAFDLAAEWDRAAARILG